MRPRDGCRDERVEVSLGEWRSGGGRGGRGVDNRSSDVAQDRRVDPVVKARGTAVGDRTNPVVVDGLVRGEDEGVALARVYPKRKSDALNNRGKGTYRFGSNRPRAERRSHCRLR